jgi:hypothetical protein
VEQAGGRPGGQEVAEADWIAVHEVTALEIVHLLQAELEEGETEAIALAHQTEARVVLLDERNARHAAKRLGLHLLGTVGVLIWAKRTGRIESLRKILDALQTQAEFRLSQRLYQRALDEVGES